MNKPFRIYFIGILLFSTLIINSTKAYSQGFKKVLHKAEVLKIEQVKSYTYLLVSENSAEKWLAVPTVEVKLGDIVFFKGGTEMPNFSSKELNKTFTSVLFLEKIGTSEIDLKHKTLKLSGSDMHQGDAQKKKVEKLKQPLTPVSGGISIANLLQNKEAYQGKIVKIKGQVTKFNTRIMGKNWIHLQDGTEYDGIYDITLTTKAVVNISDTIVLEGKLVLDQDFGYGYFYEVLIEEARLIQE